MRNRGGVLSVYAKSVKTALRRRERNVQRTEKQKEDERSFACSSLLTFIGNTSAEKKSR